MEVTQIVLTADGSHSVYNVQLGKHYHSIFGAVQESEWVYIDLGLKTDLSAFFWRGVCPCSRWDLERG